MIGESRSRKLFLSFNNIFLIAVAFICLLPMVHILAVSFSNSAAATAGKVGLFPIGFNIKSYSNVRFKKNVVPSNSEDILCITNGEGHIQIDGGKLPLKRTIQLARNF